MTNDSTAVDFGINLLEEEIDDVIFRTNEFLTDATFTGGQGPFWWLPLPILQNMTLIAVNQSLANSCLVIQNQRGTKTGQNHGKIKVRTLCSEYPLWNISVSVAKVHICPLKSEGISLFLSFSICILTFVLGLWLMQVALTSNSMICRNRVLNIVLRSVGHFPKRKLEIEPMMCQMICQLLYF